MTQADVRELTAFGVWPADIELWQLVGLARVSRVTDAELYEPDPDGALAYVTPVLVQDASGPESQRPETFVRVGNIVDLVAWDPEKPLQWRRRCGLADWLGLVPPRYLDPDAVPVRRSVLNWFRAGCTGIVVLSRDPTVSYRLLMGLGGGIVAEDYNHRRELERLLERPWPIPESTIVGGHDAAGGTIGIRERQPEPAI
jgi:hypothetical protein